MENITNINFKAFVYVNVLSIFDLITIDEMKVGSRNIACTISRGKNWEYRWSIVVTGEGFRVGTLYV